MFVNMTEAVVDRGRRLAESSERLPDGSTIKEWFQDENGHPYEISDQAKALTAYMMEVQATWMNNLAEETRSGLIGSFEKYVFPMIRAVFPNLIATELVSTQPMQGPTSLIFYMDFRAGSKKGTVNVGDTLIGARQGQEPSTSYSGEDITGETVGNTSGATTTDSPLTYFPIRPLSMQITIGTQTWTDDGNGGLVANLSGTGTIDYSTGKFSLATIDGANQSTPIVVSYRYVSEGSLQIPQMDVSITSIPVTAKPRKLRARWSVEAAAVMRAVHGTDTEQEITSAMAEELRFDIDREIINDLRNLATVPDVNTSDATDADFTFYTTPPNTVSFFEHKMTIVDTFLNHSNNIFFLTRRATANWIVAGVNVCTILESLPQFKAEAVSGSGVIYMGTLQGRWRIYKDPYLDRDEFIVGHRGNSYTETGYIYAPWIPIYFTPTVYLDDMIGRKGLMSEYAKKPVNGLFYSRGKIVHGVHP